MPGKMKNPLRRRIDELDLNLKDLDKVAISIASRNILKQLLTENPYLDELLSISETPGAFRKHVRDRIMDMLSRRPAARDFYLRKKTGREAFRALKWSDFAIIRILDYLDHADYEYADPTLYGGTAITSPFRMLWLAAKKGIGGANEDFFEDMLYLFRQLSGSLHQQLPDTVALEDWMDRHPSGLDSGIAELRKRNKNRILNTILDRINRGEIHDTVFHFDPGLTREQQFETALEWWDDHRFHLRFAVRDPDLLNEMLGNTLSHETMKVLYSAQQVGIPFFVNPYYLSLLNVHEPYFATGADLAIRDYIIYSRELVMQFGQIVAWEKEDQVEPGKPNAAGWLLPTRDSIHRRYPEVAILIPETVGRACGGLCTSCQRLYDFQRGHLNFDLSRLSPKVSWPEKLKQLMQYFENDTQLRDILITGGDALMSTDTSLKAILEAVYEMAKNKRKANLQRPDGEKYAELLRIRLGTRLPVYLPQRITPDLIGILSEFRTKARKIGIQQFIIQTHIETAMEITPEVEKAVEMLTSAGWTVTNQMVFTAAASRRGHAAKLRKVLNDIGVLPYYTFTVKGFMENYHSFIPNARAVQEQLEEKQIGVVPEEYHENIRSLPERPKKLREELHRLRDETGLPFLATDRNVLNLPGVGKSLTFRVIGITRYGRRVLEFDYDATRRHSPIINRMGRIVIIESKALSRYLRQLQQMGEDPSQYTSVYGYSIGETERREPIYEYPEYSFTVTDKYTNLQLDEPFHMELDEAPVNETIRFKQPI